MSEKFVGLYRVPSIHAATLITVAKDALCRLNVPLSKLVGSVMMVQVACVKLNMVLPYKFGIKSLVQCSLLWIFWQFVYE